MNTEAEAKAKVLNMYDFVEKMFVPFFNRPLISNIECRILNIESQ